MGYVNTPIGVLVEERLIRSVIFERLQIDYYCNRSISLKDACLLCGCDLEMVTHDLEELDRQNEISEESALANMSLVALIDHLTATHHAYIRRELPALDYLMDKVLRVHGEQHKELHNIRTIFEKFKFDLEVHIGKEEYIVFPLCVQIENADHVPLAPCVDFLDKHIDRLEAEHEKLADALRSIRAITNNYAVPCDVCSTYKVLLQGLSELEIDLHLHLFKENHILFPKALKMERILRQSQ